MNFLKTKMILRVSTLDERDEGWNTLWIFDIVVWIVRV